jgi:hypothetical protein
MVLMLVVASMLTVAVPAKAEGGMLLAGEGREREVVSVRIDNIPIEELDGFLERAGASKEAREATIEFERERRKNPDKGGGVGAGGNSGDMLAAKGIGAWVACPCSRNAGATYWWQGGGVLSSRFRYTNGAVTQWFSSGTCPMWTVCTVATMIADGPNTLNGFQASAIPGPYYLNYRCNSSGFG